MCKLFGSSCDNLAVKSDGSLMMQRWLKCKECGGNRCFGLYWKGIIVEKDEPNLFRQVVCEIFFPLPNNPMSRGRKKEAPT